MTRANHDIYPNTTAAEDITLPLLGGNEPAANELAGHPTTADTDIKPIASQPLVVDGRRPALRIIKGMRRLERLRLQALAAQALLLASQPSLLYR
jgi:hypothetical protein